MKQKLNYLIPILLIVIFIISIVPKELENDTFFTIKLGENILEQGVQKEEKLVWHENLEFTNPRWLFDVLCATIYNNFGFLGIYIGVICIASVQAILYYYILRQITNKRTFSLIITLIVMYFARAEFVARALIISFTLFLLEFYCIENLLKTNKKRYFILLCIIPIILVNVHSSVFPMYFVLYLPYIAEFILGKLNLRKTEDSKIIIENRNIRKIIILIVVGFILGFFTPNSLQPYSYMFKNMGGISKEIVQELKSLDLTEELAFLSSFIILIGITSFTKTKIRVTDAFYIIGFALMSIFTIRCIFFFYIISTICIIRIVNDWFEEYNISFNVNKKMIKTIIYFVFAILVIGNSLKSFTSKLTTNFVATDIYPVYAVEYIKNNLDIKNMKIFNHFNFGSYLEFNDIPAFIDSRSEIYTEEFNSGITILKEWNDTKNGSVHYNQLFDKYKITHALLYNNEIINIYIHDDENWRLMYQDDNFSLYERK